MSEEVTNLAAVRNSRDDKWFTVTGKVIQMNEEIHESMEQEFYLNDGFDSIRVVNWDNQDVEKGKCYQFDSVVTDEYEGTISISINSATEITEVTEDEVMGTPQSLSRNAALSKYQDDSLVDVPSIDKDQIPVSCWYLLGEREWVDFESPPSSINLTVLEETCPWDTEYQISSCVSFVGRLTEAKSHYISLYGITDDSEVVIGARGVVKNGSITEEKLQIIRNFVNADSPYPSNVDVSYSDDEMKIIILAECQNCGEIFEARDLIGANPLSPDEDYLHFYDWWRETSRHNIDVPECPDCSGELMPPEVPSEWKFKVRIPTERDIKRIEEDIQKDFNAEDVSITYSSNVILYTTGVSIKQDLPTQLTNKLDEITVKASGDRGVRGIKRRYLRFKFSSTVSIDELKMLENTVSQYQQTITRTFEKNGSVVDLSYHSVSNDDEFDPQNYIHNIEYRPQLPDIE